MNRRTIAITLALTAVAAVLLWRWVRQQRGTNRIEAQPASPSVSFEHLQEEADPEQLRYMREAGDL